MNHAPEQLMMFQVASVQLYKQGKQTLLPPGPFGQEWPTFGAVPPIPLRVQDYQGILNKKKNAML